MSEQWLPVPGYEGLYAVSDLGNVRSFHAGRGKGKRGGILKPAPTGGSSPRLAVVLYRDREGRTRLVHQLVLEAFAGPRPPDQDALHGPGGPADNRLANLRWGTRRENYLDSVRDGTAASGEKCGTAKLTAAIVLKCRRRYAAGETQAILAREFGVKPATMSDAIGGKRWAWLPGAVPVGKPVCRPKGEAHHAAKLTATQVTEIRRRYAAGEQQRPLAREFGITQGTVTKIVRRAIWK